MTFQYTIATVIAGTRTGALSQATQLPSGNGRRLAHCAVLCFVRARLSTRHVTCDKLDLYKFLGKKSSQSKGNIVGRLQCRCLITRQQHMQLVWPINPLTMRPSTDICKATVTPELQSLKAHSIRRLTASDRFKYLVYPETLSCKGGCRDVRYICEDSAGLGNIQEIPGGSETTICSYCMPEHTVAFFIHIFARNFSLQFCCFNTTLCCLVLQFCLLNTEFCLLNNESCLLNTEFCLLTLNPAF
jgi:hypothetical protein